MNARRILSLIGRRAYRRRVPMALNVAGPSLAGEGRREGSTDRPSPIHSAAVPIGPHARSSSTPGFGSGRGRWPGDEGSIPSGGSEDIGRVNENPPLRFTQGTDRPSPIRRWRFWDGARESILMPLEDQPRFTQGDGRTCSRCRRVRFTMAGPCACGAIG